MSGIYDESTCLIRTYTIEPDGPKRTLLTVQNTAGQPLTWSKSFPLSKEAFLAKYPSLAKGKHFHAEIRKGKLYDIETYEDEPVVAAAVVEERAPAVVKPRAPGPAAVPRSNPRVEPETEKDWSDLIGFDGVPVKKIGDPV